MRQRRHLSIRQGPPAAIPPDRARHGPSGRAPGGRARRPSVPILWAERRTGRGLRSERHRHQVRPARPSGLGHACSPTTISGWTTPPRKTSPEHYHRIGTDQTVPTLDRPRLPLPGRAPRPSRLANPSGRALGWGAPTGRRGPGPVLRGVRDGGVVCVKFSNLVMAADVVGPVVNVERCPRAIAQAALRSASFLSSRKVSIFR